MDEYSAEYDYECYLFGRFLWLNRNGTCLHLSKNKYLHFIKILELAQTADAASQKRVYEHSIGVCKVHARQKWCVVNHVPMHQTHEEHGNTLSN